MTERDEQESRSKFWNKGKWDNFVKPFLPDDCSEMVLTDMGCCAGLFLKLAEDMGFDRVVGVEPNSKVYKTAQEYRKRNGGKYKLIHHYVEKVVDSLPIADFTVLANVHYYLTIDDWLSYLDRLKFKTRHCIVVSAAKDKGRIRIEKARPELEIIKSYFSEWNEVGTIDNISPEGDPAPRNVYSACFESSIKRVDMESLLKMNRGGGSMFFDEIERSVPIHELEYYSWLKENSRTRWTRGFDRYMKDKVKLYHNVKANYLRNPIIINSENKIVDGNHRVEIMKYLGYKTVLTRRVP